MFRSQQHGEHVCYGHSLHFMEILIARFPILFISMIDYADHMPCMNCKKKRNQSRGSKDEACICLTDRVVVNNIGHPHSMKL
jgi:hypothetical protein